MIYSWDNKLGRWDKAMVMEKSYNSVSLLIPPSDVLDDVISRCMTLQQFMFFPFVVWFTCLVIEHNRGST